MFVFLGLFTLALLIANGICFFKRKYLYLFIPCMLFLPSYYGIHISDSLPVITMARIMFILFYIYAYINRKRSINIKEISIKNLPKEYFFLYGYFILRIVTNLYYATTYGQPIKTIFLIIFEQLLFLLAIYLLALTKEELTTLLKVVVYVATALFVIGIFESITSIRPFDALYTAQRYMLNDHYVRLGLLRATTTLGLPGFYGNMCILMLPAIFYLYEITRHKRFLVIAGLDILAMIHSGSRSDVFFTTAVIIAYFLYVVKGKERKLLFCKNALAVICSLLLVVIACSLINDNLRYFYSGSCKAVLNEVGFDFDLDKDAPDDVNGFGVNPTGSISRTRQLSGLTYTARINPIFGLGSGAQVRGDVQYYWKDEWHVVYSYDLGFVETFCDEGFIGILAMISLFIFMIATSKNSRFLQLSVFSYLLSTLSTANMYTFLFAFILIEISLRKQNG